jgi:putative transposase
MPRKSRIDAPGALHHIIVRGIEQRRIFRDDIDRERFLERLGAITTETHTPCLAWSLLPNHFHLLLKTGSVPIATVMRRLLTGFAIAFNRRHSRHGHLFQNRYKSILCQEDTYLKELVRYIHLNPLRAGVVRDLNELGTYRYCGHSALLGKGKQPWQEVNAVLAMFDHRLSPARRLYRMFVEAGLKQGRRDDLIGGGLLRSVGGWSNLQTLRDAKIFYKSDERILGDSQFVQEVLSTAEEELEKRYALRAAGLTLNKLVTMVAEVMGLDPSIVLAPGKERVRVKARSLLCYWAVRELGISLTELSRRLDLCPAAISKSVVRGECIAKEESLSLIDGVKVKK